MNFPCREILSVKGGVNMQRFYCKTKIITGPAGQVLQSLRPEKLFLVTDPYFDQKGVAQSILAQSGAKESRLFSEITPDPSVELAATGTAKVKEFAPDTIVALGGGSAMDCAKAMAYFYNQPVKLVAIPTTSGSGSEVTDFAVLTHGNTKYPLVDEKVRPDVAILDESLLKELPKGLVADTGFDVLSHALEAYVAADAGAITDALASAAFCTALAHLPASYSGNTAVRGKLHQASCMAGMAFSQAGLGLCHAMAHSLGGMFHIPHGRLNAILLPSVVACNAEAATEKYAKLARAAGISGAADTVAVRNLKNTLIRLRRELGMPENLTQAGVPPRMMRGKVKDIVEATLQDPCCKTNPVKVEDFMVRKILEEVAGHG